MKMFKKLMAVALVGVMAVSMLTGCALSDKIKAEAIEGALNSEAVQGTVTVDYKYENDLNGKAEKMWTDSTILNKEIPAALPTTLTTKTIGSKDYAYFILKAPKNADAKKDLEWVAEAKKFNTQAAANIDATTNAAAGKIHNYAAATTTEKKVKFGVHFVSETKSGTTTNYAIVVVELNKAAD